jgi:hypothetical protein
MGTTDLVYCVERQAIGAKSTLPTFMGRPKIKAARRPVMSENPDDPTAALGRLLSHILLSHAGLMLDLAGLIDFLDTRGMVSSEDLRSHLQVYREHHEQSVRDEIIEWFRTSPELIDPTTLFGSPPQSSEGPP